MGRGRYAMTMEEDWVWMPHKTAVPAVHMAVSVHPPPPGFRPVQLLPRT